jgi:hypothetical protein
VSNASLPSPGQETSAAVQLLSEDTTRLTAALGLLSFSGLATVNHAASVVRLSLLMN